MSSLKDSTLCKLVSTIGKRLYICTEGLPEEEKWNVQNKLRNRASDVISWSAEAIGSIDPRDAKWAFGKARANLFVVEATYNHACDIGLLSIDHEIMTYIKQAIEDIDKQITKATADIPGWFEEMQPGPDKRNAQ